MKKRTISLILLFCFGLAMTAFAVSSQITIKVIPNSIKIVAGNMQNLNADNFQYKNSTYVPIRAVSEALGASVIYDKGSNTAFITNDSAQGNAFIANALNTCNTLNKECSDLIFITSCLNEVLNSYIYNYDSSYTSVTFNSVSKGLQSIVSTNNYLTTGGSWSVINTNEGELSVYNYPKGTITAVSNEIISATNNMQYYFNDLKNWYSLSSSEQKSCINGLSDISVAMVQNQSKLMNYVKTLSTYIKEQ